MKGKALRRLTSIVLSAALTVSSLGTAAMAATADTTSITAASAGVVLKDIGSSYAQKEIQALVDSGIIGGFEDGTFRPNEPMTRAQLAKVLVLSLGLKEAPEGAASFTDVPNDAWYKGFIGALVQSKITDGTSATTFSPDSQVSREQLAVFFIRAFGLEEQAKKVSTDVALKDLNEVADWAKPYVALAFKIGFIQGVDNGDGTISFNPKASAERQALARLAYEFKVNREAFVKKAEEVANGEDTTNPETPETTEPTPVGGGGGGGSKKKDSQSQVSVINSGGTINGNVTLGAGTYGPTTGTAVINGTLTLNPGETGEVTLNNVQAANVVVASGAANSIHLKNVKVTVKLVVNAGSQTVSVRIVAEGNTQVAATDISSKATIEVADDATGTGFGDIVINPTSANQQIGLKGKITGKIKVTGSQSVGLNVYGSVGKIEAESEVSINAETGAEVGQVDLNSANAKVSLKGNGTIQNVVAAVVGAVLNISDDVQVTKVKVDVKIKLEASKEKVKNIAIEVPDGADAGELIESVVDGIMDAIKLALANNALNIGYADGDSKTRVTHSLTLPATAGTEGATVTWVSSNTDVINNNGTVHRPNDGKAVKVTLTATISLNGLTGTKKFEVTVIPHATGLAAALGVIKTSTSDAWIEADVKEPVDSHQEVSFVVPGAATDFDKLTKLVFYANNVKEMTFTNELDSHTVTFGDKDSAEVLIKDILQGLMDQQDLEGDGASIGKIRTLISEDSDHTLVLNGVLKDANNNEMTITVKVTAAQAVSFNVTGASVKIGSTTYDVAQSGIVNGNVINFTIPSAATDSELITDLKMTVSGSPKRLEFVHMPSGYTEPVVVSVPFVGNTVTTTVAVLLGDMYDKGNDGVAVGVLRTFMNASEEVVGTIYDAQGFPKEVTIRVNKQ